MVWLTGALREFVNESIYESFDINFIRNKQKNYQKN